MPMGLLLVQLSRSLVIHLLDCRFHPGVHVESCLFGKRIFQNILISNYEASYQATLPQFS